MKLRADQLKDHIKQPLQPIYIVSGDTQLLVQEAVDALVKAARKQEFTEREVFHHNRSFDWNQLRETSASLSLFGDKKILELKLGSDKPNEAGKSFLHDYAASAGEDNILIIVANKFDASMQKTKWFKGIEAKAVWIQIWPIAPQQLPQWIKQRMLQAGLKPQNDAVQLIADRVEGNLLAAAQEIEKLKLLYGEAAISLKEVQSAVTVSSRFDVFSLVDTALLGQGEKSLRMLLSIKAEGIDATVVLWALTREIRGLSNMRQQVENGMPVGKVIQEYRVWANRKSAMQNALQRLTVKSLHHLLQQASLIDLAIKGSGAFSAWDGLSNVLLRLSGARVNPKLLALPR